MDLVPDILAFSNQEALLALQHRSAEQVGLDALRVTRATAKTVDGRWAYDCDLHTGRGLLTSPEDDFIHVAVEGV